jgi:signal transduction histidine kinase
MKKVLVIGSVGINADQLKYIFKQYFPGFFFLSASSGREGIEVAQQNIPEIILLDLFIQDMNVDEVTGILKSDPLTVNIPLVLIGETCINQQEQTPHLFTGADACFSKPLNSEEFKSLVDIVLRLKKAENGLRRSQKQIENYQRKIKNLTLDVTVAEEEERKRIAEYLHDNLGQTLSLIYINLSSLAEVYNNSGLQKGLKQTTDLVNKAITESRVMLYELYPPVLHELGLLPAITLKLEQIENNYNIKTVFVSELKKLDISKAFNIFLYRIVAELFNNVLNHADASRLEFEVKEKNKFYYFIVRDDGKGIKNDFLKHTPMRGFGLMSIKERLKNMNGNLNIESNPSAGTVVTVRIPVNKK